MGGLTPSKVYFAIWWIPRGILMEVCLLLIKLYVNALWIGRAWDAPIGIIMVSAKLEYRNGCCRTRQSKC